MDTSGAAHTRVFNYGPTCFGFPVNNEIGFGDCIDNSSNNNNQSK